MTSPVDGSHAGPVVQTARIDAIDVLRGFALLGILLMNVQSFAMPQAAYFNPTAYGDLEGANLNVWVAVRMLADQKFMTIFSMLFGAGIVLMAERAEARGDARRVHYRRMAWLLVIGLLHAHLLWAGDILFLYAVCGMLVYPLRHQPPGRLIAMGVGLLAVASAYSIGSGLSLPYWPEEAREGFAAGVWRPAPEVIEAELAAMRGGWLDQAAHPVGGGPRVRDPAPDHLGPLARGRADADRDGALQARGLQRRVLPALLRGAHRGGGGGRPAAPGLRHRPRLRPRMAVLVVLHRGAVQLLAEHRGQPGLRRAGDADLSDGGAPRLHPPVRGGRPDRADQLPAADGALHDDLLRATASAGSAPWIASGKSAWWPPFGPCSSSRHRSGCAASASAPSSGRGARSPTASGRLSGDIPCPRRPTDPPCREPRPALRPMAAWGSWWGSGPVTSRRFPGARHRRPLRPPAPSVRPIR